MRSRSLASLLIVLLAWTSLPAWSVQSQPGHAASLACVHACALSAALMTQDGRLPSMAAGQCLVRSSAAPATLQVDGVKACPAVAATAPVPALAAGMPVLASAFSLGQPRRGPPAYGGFLWSQHPSAQAPPTL